MALLDHRGQPVQVRGLGKEISAAKRGTVRTPFDPIIAAGLTPQRLAALLSSAQANNAEAYLLLAREMEQRDPHYFSVMQTRKLAVAQLPRRVEAPSEDSNEVKLAEMLTGIVNGEGFTDVLFHMLDGVGKGYSVTEIIWDTTKENGRLWLPKALKYRRPNWYRFSDDDGETILLRTELSPEGEPLAPYKFIVHVPQVLSGSPVAGGLARVVAILHMFKNYTLKDWMSFAEVFGQPIRIGKYPQGADEADVETLRQAVQAVGADACAVFPQGMTIDFERSANSGFASGDDFFLKLHDALNAEISKAVLGQTMTTEDGSSLAQAKVHDDVRKDIRDADARQLADTLNRDLIRPIVDLNFGPRANQEDYPRLVIDTEDQEDLESLATSLAPFIDRGLPVEAAVIWDKFNLPEPKPGALLLVSNAKNVNKVTLTGTEAPEPPAPAAAPKGKPKANAAELKLRVLDALEGETNLRKLRPRLLEILEDA